MFPTGTWNGFFYRHIDYQDVFNRQWKTTYCFEFLKGLTILCDCHNEIDVEEQNNLSNRFRKRIVGDGGSRVVIHGDSEAGRLVIPLTDQINAILNAPIPFFFVLLGAVATTVVIAWRTMEWLYKERMERAKDLFMLANSETEIKTKKVDRLQDELTEKVESFTKEIESLSSEVESLKKRPSESKGQSPEVLIPEVLIPEVLSLLLKSYRL